MIKQSFFPVVASIVIFLALVQRADAQATDRRVTIDDLGDMLAKVDGKPIRKSDVFPSPIPGQVSLQNTIKPTVARYIDSMLMAQAAEVEGLDKTPAFRQGMMTVEQKSALAGIDALAGFYQSRLPGIVAAGDRSTITDAEATAYVKRNLDLFRGKSRGEAIQAAQPYVARGRYIGSQIDWMTENLNIPIKINGQSFSEATIIEAIDAADARYWMPTSVLIEATIKIVIAEEAAASGDNRKEIRADAERVRELIAAAKLEIGDQAFVLGNSTNVSSVLSLINPVDMPKIRPVVLELVKNIVMADMARAEGLDSDKEYAAQAKLLPLMIERGRIDVLVRLYQEKHADAGDADAIAASLRDGAKIEYLLD
ncbi:MAG: hypothetical protein ACKJSG_05330 [Lentisphaeria bacterium]